MAKLGYSSVTLTDLTDTLPVLLVLESNLTKSVQTKTGNKYDPDYAQEGVIITPSLYLGQEDLQIEKHPYFVDPEDTGKQRDNGYIQYEIENKTYYYGSSTENSSIYVDIEGKLHYKKNLEDNITIEAYIRNFYLPDHNTTVELVQATNPITIVLLEDSNNYYAVIECVGGREHFEDSNASDIAMTAKLYQGIDEVSSENLEYEWQALGGEIKENKNNQIFSVKRKDVFNREYYTCTITDNSTGLTYSASKLIQDFTDTYDCNIEYDVMPIFTDEEKTITLTAETYYRSERLEGKQGFNLSYAWIAKSKTTGADEIVLEESTSSVLEITNSNLPVSLRQQDFIVYCKVFQTTTTNEHYQIAGDTLVVSYTSPFSVNIEGRTIFVPTSSSGNYQGNDEKQYTFRFQLLGEDGQPITYNSSGSSFPKDINTENATISFSPKEPAVWEFTGTVTLETDNWANLDDSIMYSFSYTYLGQVFTETITVVKQFKGQDGDQGFSGYTIDLSNEFHTFSGGEMRADSKQETTCEVLAFYGDNSLHIQEIKINDETIIYSAEESKEKIKYSFGENNSSLFFTVISTESGKATIIIETNEDEDSDFLIDIQPIPLYISVSENQNDSSDKWKTFYKQFSYTINYYGKSYSINPSENNIIYKADGNYHPNEFSVNATCQEESGVIKPYNEGKIVYSFDNGTSWKLLPTSAGTGKITNYSNLDNIQIRLYSRIADITGSNLTAEHLNTLSSYLLDTETIPILTSMEGYEFGGENLIRWSKTLTEGNSKWRISNVNGLSIKKEVNDDFYYMDFNLAEPEDGKEHWYSFTTPKISFKKEMIGQNFCVSFMIYSDDYEAFSTNSLISVVCTLDKTFQQTNRSRFKRICTIKNTEAASTAIFKTPLQKGSWSTVYQTFKLTGDLLQESDDESKDLELTEDNFKFLKLQFYIKNSGSCKIKKPQLIMGNIYRDWQASPYDISLENISGINLLDNVLQREIVFNEENSFRNVLTGGISLQPGTFYSLSYNSFKNKEGKQVSLYLVLENSANSSEEVLKEISLPNENFSFLITPNNSSEQLSLYSYNPSTEKSENGKELICLITCLKLEKGKYSTSWFLTNEQVDEMLDLQLVNYNLLDVDGSILQFASKEDFQDYTEELGKIQQDLEKVSGTVNVLNTNYSNVSTAVGNLQEGGEEDYLGKISRGAITLGYEEGTTKPFLILSSASADKSFSMELTNTSLSFYQGRQLLAEMSGSSLKIPYLSSQKIKIGPIVIKQTSTGVGILWED